MEANPTVVDTIRGIKKDVQKIGMSAVSTVKTARHSAGHLGFRNRVRNVRRNLNMPDKNTVERIRKGITANTEIKRPGILFDENGKPNIVSPPKPENDAEQQQSHNQDMGCDDGVSLYGRVEERDTGVEGNMHEKSAQEEEQRKPSLTFVEEY